VARHGALDDQLYNGIRKSGRPPDSSDALERVRKNKGHRDPSGKAMRNAGHRDPSGQCTAPRADPEIEPRASHLDMCAAPRADPQIEPRDSHLDMHETHTSRVYDPPSHGAMGGPHVGNSEERHQMSTTQRPKGPHTRCPAPRADPSIAPRESHLETCEPYASHPPALPPHRTRDPPEGDGAAEQGPHEPSALNDTMTADAAAITENLLPFGHVGPQVIGTPETDMSGSGWPPERGAETTPVSMLKRSCGTAYESSRAQADKVAKEKRRTRFGNDGFGDIARSDADADSAPTDSAPPPKRTSLALAPVPRGQAEAAQSRQAEGTATAADEVTLSHTISRGVSARQGGAMCQPAREAQVDTEASPTPSTSAPRRPPTGIDGAAVAAAVRMGMRSAGLAWMQQANAEGSARSTAQPRSQQQEREPQGRADVDVPMIGEPPRHPREVTLPVPEGFEWPEFAFCAFYEHSGEEREAYLRAMGGAPTCSVSDRRSILPPSPGAWHFIGTVQDFVAAYPHPIRLQSNHITCGYANWASWPTWASKIRDGSMRRAAEELLWVMSIGDRCTGEQPPTAHQHTVGPPTFVVNGHDFGAPSKTYCKWLRNLPPIAPTSPLPPDERWSELSVSGDKQVKTVKRSYTPRNMAEAEAHAYAQVTGGDESEFGRPAGQPCKGYQEWRKQLAHAFGLFAAHYAPTLSMSWLFQTDRAPAIILVPITQSDVGVCAMVSLRDEHAVYGIARDVSRGGAEQGEEAAVFLTEGVETQYAAPISCFGHEDCVVAVPWATPPITVLTLPAQRGGARAAGLSAAWCTASAMHDHAMYLPAGIAFQRVAALSTTGKHGAQQPGIWTHALPLVRARTARAWAQGADMDTGERGDAREQFMNSEAQRGEEIRQCLLALETGDGELTAIADSVKTAADYDAEIPFPLNGLPVFDSAALRLAPYIERPLHLCTSWFARLPPQQVPPGFTPLPWTGILRGWARRAICKGLNATADRDFDSWRLQCESALPRPKYICIGPGGAKEIAHADGIGAYNALTIVWEYDAESGLYDKMDFQRPGQTHWVLNVLRRIFGEHDDQQLMALIMQGVRWGVKAPMQIRIAPNLERLDSRIRGVGAAFRKLLKKGLYYKYKKLRRANERISPEGPGPFVIIPPYVVGTGGTDKPDNPDEKRIVGDAGAPHPEQEVRERNSPHGEPGGPVQISLNDMMGPPPGTTPRGQRLDDSRYPMPDPETKPRPRHVYNDLAVARHMARANNTYLVGLKDDGRHMFFQFENAPEEERTCSFVVLVELPVVGSQGEPMLDADGNELLELWFIIIVATCMNMGSRNASKIAQRFTDRLLEGFSCQLDIYVRDVWLPRQTKALQELVAERTAKLGAHQARPFATSGYTDDYAHVYVGPELFAAGTLIWRTICGKANYWLSAKACAGTVLDYIGGRVALNGGFGCLSPSKHARAVADSTATAEGRITREELESHNSFLVHVHDWLDFPEGTLKGLSAPLKLPGTPEQVAVISEKVREQHRAILLLLRRRHAASFWSGINEASIGGVDAIVFAPRLTTDSCSDVAKPYICGVANGLYFRYPLEGAWRRRHITLTETCGTMLALIIFPRYFPEGELMLESDATTALAAARGTAASEDIIYAHRRADQIPAVREAKRRAWITHCKGWANGLSDAGSRDKMVEMRALAEAFGIRLREVPVPPEAHEFMCDVLSNTADVEPQGAGHATTMGRHNLNMIGDMPVAHPGEGAGDGTPVLPGRRLRLLGTPVVRVQVPTPRPTGWEDSDDDVEDEVNVDERCARCYHRYFPVRTCRCATPLLLDEDMRRWRKLRIFAWVAGKTLLALSRATERVYAPQGSGYHELAADWEARMGREHAPPSPPSAPDLPDVPGSPSDEMEGDGAPPGAGPVNGGALRYPDPSVARRSRRARRRVVEYVVLGRMVRETTAAGGVKYTPVIDVDAEGPPGPPRRMSTVPRDITAFLDETDGASLASTARGRHNLSMTGTPIAHLEMRELLDQLSTALHENAQPAEVVRIAQLIAARLNARRMRQGMAACVVAVCRALKQPQAYPTLAAAACASGCSESKARAWRNKIEGALRHEAEQQAVAGAPQQVACATQQAVVGAAGSTPGADGEAGPACTPDELGALGALVMLAQEEQASRATDGSTAAGQPPSAPPSPPGVFDPDGLLVRFDRAARVSNEDETVATPEEWDAACADLAAELTSLPCLRPPRAIWTAAGGGTQHDTSLGRHNLNMVGNMPIAHVTDVPESPEPLQGPRGPRRSPRLAQQDTPAPLLAAAAAAGGSTAQRQARPTGTPGDLIGRLDARGGGRRAGAIATPSPEPEPLAAGSGPFEREQRGRAGAAAIRRQLPSPQLAPPPMQAAYRHAKCEDGTAAIDDEMQAQPRTRCASPQPATAAEARSRAAKDTARRLEQHDSRYALFKGRPELLHDVVIDAAAARDAGIPHGTASADEWGFKWVARFGKETGNPWMRPREVLTTTDVMCEVWFTIMALVWITQMMAPSSRRLAAGYGQGKPTSGLLAIYAYRRVMRDCGRYVPEMTETLRVLKGLCARYKLRWGDDAFVVMRKQPFATAHIVAIVAALVSPANVMAWPAVLRTAVLTAFCHAMSTGARKDEWAASFRGDTYLRRSSFAWVGDDGNDLPSTPEVVASRRDGHMLRGRSAPSKCDRLNIEWGSRDMWFRYDSNRKINFAWRWQMWEMAHPCPEGERQRWPAFSPTGDSVPFTGGHADACLKGLLAMVMSAAEAAKRSWHSARVTIATRLYARRGDTTGGIARDEIEGIIQAVVRWKTPEAQRLYTRMAPSQYADYVDMATDMRRESDGTMPADLPEVDPAPVLAETEGAVAAIESEIAKAARDKRAAQRDAAAGDAGAQRKRRATPGTGELRSGAATPTPTTRTFDIGDGQVVAEAGQDSWNIAGQLLRVHNSFWGWGDDEYSECRVVAYIGAHEFAAAARPSTHTYVIECDGIHYPAPHTTVAAALDDAAVKRRIRKAANPTLL
jgi:hypothetical protein